MQTSFPLNGMNRVQNDFTVKRLCLLLLLSVIPFAEQKVNAAEGWGEFDRMQVQLEGDSFSNAVTHLSGNTIASLYKEKNGGIELMGIISTSGSPYASLKHLDPNVKEPIWAERLESNHQFNDGRWCLTASNKEEMSAQSIWQGSFDPTRPGSYDVEIYLISKSNLSLKLQFNLEKSIASVEIECHASPRIIQAFQVGRIKVPAPNTTKWSLKLPNYDNGTIELSHIVLRPAPEGERIRQLTDGSVLLHARDSTTHGKKLQYEHLPHKNTVGYWIYETDYPSWQFELLRPGRYAVEVLQGCGTGHGGSKMNLKIHNTSLSFIVEETGHFQHFVPRIVGEVALPRPDHYKLELIPVKKAGGAVMDVRQIRLIPVARTP